MKLGLIFDDQVFVLRFLFAVSGKYWPQGQSLAFGFS
jgi:hypothetical protein